MNLQAIALTHRRAKEKNQIVLIAVTIELFDRNTVPGMAIQTTAEPAKAVR